MPDWGPSRPPSLQPLPAMAAGRPMPSTSAESDYVEPVRGLAGGLLQAPLHHARVSERAFVDGPDRGYRSAQVLLDRLQRTLHPAPKLGILLAGPIPGLRRTGAGPRLDAWLEVEFEHP